MSETKIIIPLFVAYESRFVDLEDPLASVLGDLQRPQLEQTFTVDMLSSDRCTVWGYKFTGRLARPIAHRAPTPDELEFARAMKPALDKLQEAGPRP